MLIEGTPKADVPKGHTSLFVKVIRGKEVGKAKFITIQMMPKVHLIQFPSNKCGRPHTKLYSCFICKALSPMAALHSSGTVQLAPASVSMPRQVAIFFL